MKQKLLEQIRRIFSWYFSRKAMPYWCVILADCVILVGSFFISHLINFGTINTTDHLSSVLLGLGLFFICYLIGFRCFKTYRGVVRYSTFRDLWQVAGAVLVGSALLVGVRLVFGGFDSVADAILIDDVVVCAAICVVGMWVMRLVLKTLYDEIQVKDKAPSILIMGTRSAGVGLAKSIRTQSPSPYHVLGFITDDPEVAKYKLVGLPVLFAQHDDLYRYIKDRHIEAVLISPLLQDYFVNECQALIDFMLKQGVKIMMIPEEQEWDGHSDLSHNSLKEVSVESLLPRKKIEVDLEAIGRMLKDKRILITGAAGSIGSEMVRQIAKFSPEEMVLIDQAETPMHDIRLMMSRSYNNVKCSTIVGSISNATHMEEIFRAHRPDYVFHAAAYKHVPMMEDNPAMAVQNNVYGTRVIADLAVRYGTQKFVMISTDKAVNPTNVMGCSKRICEIYCQSLNHAIAEGTVKQGDGSPAVTQFVTTRFGNVLGSNGSVIPIFADQIRKGGPVTVTHPDIIRFFMLIPEACRLVLEAGTMGHGGEIFVFDMGEPVRIADLARRMIYQMGAKDVEIKFTGLRDGEKLYEEVLSEGENDRPTVHPKIKVAAVREYPYEEALRNEEELYRLSFSYDDMAIVAKMKEIVPEYRSQHSKYEALDK